MNTTLKEQFNRIRNVVVSFTDDYTVGTTYAEYYHNGVTVYDLYKAGNSYLCKDGVEIARMYAEDERVELKNITGAEFLAIRL